MPQDRVLNLPLSGDEIIEILVQRFEAVLRRDCYLHPANTYNGFSYSLTMNLKLKDMNFGKETLVWDQHKDGEQEATGEVKEEEKYDSGDSPNQTRLDHDLGIPVERQEGRKKVIRKQNFPKESANANR